MAIYLKSFEAEGAQTKALQRVKEIWSLKEKGEGDPSAWKVAGMVGKKLLENLGVMSGSGGGKGKEGEEK